MHGVYWKYIIHQKVGNTRNSRWEKLLSNWDGFVSSGRYCPILFTGQSCSSPFASDQSGSGGNHPGIPCVPSASSSVTGCPPIRAARTCLFLHHLPTLLIFRSQRRHLSESQRASIAARLPNSGAGTGRAAASQFGLGRFID